MSVYEKKDSVDRVYVNSVGEGGIWVNSENGNLKVGDYICSSSRPGIGMKQTVKTLMNYTVAKITQAATFTSDTTVMFVGCTYHCG